ncbi:bifunctional acetate--CoA ligase family protein/GNAT family N-acetyltransferase [Aminobacter sp. SR38]|jgi:acetyltransferase|uniref:bifunctional acetate--CoA ligase family protein/GNAT family N-acetyltransferase n=1 Tax=Aminobacter sp. SR38 TaxID=2774562 RepID=UPI00178317D7|nr:bifunctional acetate--CoA ligase family protein/GNAT family N-acetyltransferase [Aminobacter sp. SR38]QOF71323.1 bifunctional acetate--CoA ligase family protein/GNAT family N-acetyltransferase [Aminobacter sp. SR38]
MEEEVALTIRNLEFVLHPRSIAIFGASTRPGSVGAVVIENIVQGGFEGPIWPVNPKYREIAGRPCYRSAKELPEAPDLSVIVTPAETVPGIVRDLGNIGSKAAVVITAGLTVENGLKQAMLEAAKPNLFRIVGPNTLGLLTPKLKLNASFSHCNASPGGIALLSQSGAIVTALVDWSLDNNVGFSHIVSLGDMADVDVGDYLDLLASDPSTHAILMYLETIPHPRKFMSAARAAARLKPVVAIKSGRHDQAAKAAMTHTGALAGGDRAVSAAFTRAGILRVGGLIELFDAAEILALLGPLQQTRLGIVTNGGGAGVLAVDDLLDRRCELAAFAPATVERLNACLPSTWSKGNPVDIIGDASPRRYAEAIEAVAADPGTDALMVLNCPTGLASSTDAALAVSSIARSGKIDGKPLITCWLGESTARQGRHLLQNAGVPSFETPAEAAQAASYLSEWSRAQAALMRVPPESGSAYMADRSHAIAIFRAAAADGRQMLTEAEAKELIAAYGIATPKTVVAKSPADVEKAAAAMLLSADKVVVKLVSRDISHKSDVGGVALDLGSAEAARDAAEAICLRVQHSAPDASVDGFTVQPMISRRSAYELLVGIHQDPIFGPVIMFGSGGVAVELLDDTAVSLPPLDDVLAGDLIDNTRAGRLLAGYRDREPANRAAILGTLDSVSRLVVDFRCIKSMDINPLLSDREGAVALDARIQFDPSLVEDPAPNADLVIRPYPSMWERDIEVKGQRYIIRPIKPTDVALYPAFLAKVTREDMRLRFLSPRKHFPDQMLKRMTQLDYDREIAFVVIARGGDELAGIGRLSCDPDHVVAEYALLVRTDLQGQGIGWELLNQLIDYAREDGIAKIEGMMLAENHKMLSMCRVLGFMIQHEVDDPGLCRASLRLKPRANAEAND